MADAGAPDWARNLDYVVIMLGSAGVLAAFTWVVAGKHVGTTPLGFLLFRSPRRGWLRVTLLASAPMVLGGLVLRFTREAEPILDQGWTSVLSGVVRAPIVEEVFFRGLMVALPAALIARGKPWSLRGRRFWILAVLSGIVFGSVHIHWSVNGLANGWPNLLVTAAGGVWYAWIMRSWRSILVPMLLHAAMNLGWLLADAGGGAGGGGLIENLLRAGTISVGTWLTIRANGAEHASGAPITDDRS